MGLAREGKGREGRPVTHSQDWRIGTALLPWKERLAAGEALRRCDVAGVAPFLLLPSE